MRPIVRPSVRYICMSTKMIPLWWCLLYTPCVRPMKKFLKTWNPFKYRSIVARVFGTHEKSHLKNGGNPSKRERGGLQRTVTTYRRYLVLAVPSSVLVSKTPQPARLASARPVLFLSYGYVCRQELKTNQETTIDADFDDFGQ